MKLEMEDVKYKISSDVDVPEIYINGEQAWIVSCSTHWVTWSPMFDKKTKMLTATVYLDSETQRYGMPVKHVLTIDTARKMAEID